MKKLILLVKRKPGLTAEQFREYYEKTHTQLALKLLPGFKSYQRNYVRHDLTYRPAHIEARPIEPNFDVIVEMTFETDDDYQKMARTLADPNISRQIVEDGERFMDRGSMQMFFVDEEKTEELNPK
jgi:hypothetical protein